LPTNTAINYAVFEAVRRNNIPRIVYGCSDSSTGFGIHNAPLKPLYVPIDEAHPLWPHESYSLSKHFGERMGRELRRGLWDGGHFPALQLGLGSALAGEGSPNGGGESGGYLRPGHGLAGRLHFRADVARACLAAASYRFPAEQAIAYEAFFLTAANTSYAIPTLELLGAIYGDLPPQKDPDYFAADPYATIFDIRKAERLLGWTPKDLWQNFEMWEF